MERGGARVTGKLVICSSLSFPPSAPTVVLHSPISVTPVTQQAAAFKRFILREKVTTVLRGEFYNAFNHAQWSTINTSAQFNPAGLQVNSLFGRATADRGPRVVQLALRVDF